MMFVSLKELSANMVETKPGRLSVYRVNSQKGPRIEIYLQEEGRSGVFIEIEVQPKEWGEVVSGFGYQPVFYRIKNENS